MLSSGIDLKNFDKSVRAQDDFYRHVNGKWLDSFEIPSDKSNYGSFTKLADEAEKNIRSIIDSAPKGTKIGDFFAAYMNQEQVEKLRTAPLTQHLERIRAISTKKELVRFFGESLRSGLRTPIYFYVNQDLKKSTEYIGYLHHSGLGLPDRDYYLKEGERFEKYRSAYTQYMQNLSDAAGAEIFSPKIDAIMKLEKALANAHWSRVENRNRDKTYNKYSYAKLSEASPGFDWQSFFEGARIPTPDAVVVRQPPFLAELSRLTSEVDLETWKSYLVFGLLDRAAPLLSQAFVQANFNFRMRALRGISENKPRWKRAVSALNSALGEELGREYVKKHFKPEAKTRMKALVENLEAAFDKSIDELDWMTQETKAEAKIKLKRFVAKIGYPDQWKDYSGLEVKADDLFGNALRSSKFEFDRDIKKLGGPIDRTEWFMTPQTVNAYYNPPMNEIVFPAAILQPPFFNLSADDAVNYGAIGAVIGHELSHGFDDQGRKSDGDGNLRDWWSEADAKEFKRRSEIMVEQYNQYEPLEGKQVNGKLTLGENIGDLGGLTIAYKAYQMSLAGKKSSKIDGYTGEQRFFIGWSQIWRRKYRKEELERRLMTDSHSPSEYRVIGILANMPEFYEAFGVKEGDAMFRPKAKRIKIW